MYPGYVVFGGMEILNSARTEAYVEHAGVSWFRSCSECGDLAAGLGDAAYTSPLQDEAPWVDPDNPDSWGFWGIYPLDIGGFDDSTTTAEAVEGVRAGGVVGNRRAGTRTLTYHVLLMGIDDAAAMAGMAWLRMALDGTGCNTPGAGCGGDDLCFLSTCPPVCVDLNDPTECLSGYWRTFRRVTTTEGPKVTAKNQMSDDAAVWEVEFTMVAAVPFAYGERRVVGVGGTVDTGDLFRPLASFPPIIGMPEVACPGPATPPAIYDPFCTIIMSPPVVPVVESSFCVDMPTVWDRYSMQIPAEFVPGNGVAVPSITIRAGGSDLRMLRVRFYGDPLGWFDPQDLDPCAFCGEFLITYLKGGYEIVLDGMDESIIMQDPLNVAATAVNASSVVTSTDDTGFVWPLLTCGMAYIVTLDLPTGTPPLGTVQVAINTRAYA